MGDLTKNFSTWEFLCPCGQCNKKPDIDFVRKLQLLRDFYRKPMEINSGVRCIKHNQKVGGASNSQHLYGVAADIRIVGGADKFRFVELAMHLGFRGIGVSKTFVHVDMRATRKVMWTYD